MTQMVLLRSPSSFPLSTLVFLSFSSSFSVLLLWVWIHKSLLVCSGCCFRFLLRGSWTIRLWWYPGQMDLVDVPDLQLLDLRGVFALWSVSTCCSDSIIFRRPLILLWASSGPLRTRPPVAPCPDSPLGSLQLSLTSASSCRVARAFQLRSFCICWPSTDLPVTTLEVPLITSSQSVSPDT